MEETTVTISALNTVWVLIASFLVFIMHAGFALLEAGFTQAKNTVNIILKNFMGVSTGMVAFLVLGFGLMFGSGNAFVGKEFFMLNGLPEVWGTIPSHVFFFFQAIFAATAATIVSGAVAERTKFSAYIIFSILLTAVAYPIVGHWIWGGGWLAERGFLDFAGSTVVHSVGGWAALAGVLIIGPRIGRFSKDYDQKKFDGHSIPLAALGVFILWFGWFGFNPGSQLAAEGAENASAIGLIALNTVLGGCLGAIGAMVLSWVFTRMVKVGFVLNGALGGLVGVTAGCAFISPDGSLLVGLIGGMMTVFVAQLLEKYKIDDAVGAVPVHLGAGLWGTLAVGLFHTKNGLLYGGGWNLLGTQIIGIVTVGLFTFIFAWASFKTIHKYMGARAAKNEEESGLDLKHGQAAYARF